MINYLSSLFSSQSFSIFGQKYSIIITFLIFLIFQWNTLVVTLSTYKHNIWTEIWYTQKNFNRHFSVIFDFSYGILFSFRRMYSIFGQKYSIKKTYTQFCYVDFYLHTSVSFPFNAIVFITYFGAHLRYNILLIFDFRIQCDAMINIYHYVILILHKRTKWYHFPLCIEFHIPVKLLFSFFSAQIWPVEFS